MKNHCFTNTHKELYHSFNLISSSLNELYKLPASFWTFSLTSDNSCAKRNLANMYTINQSIINTLAEVKTEIVDGKINNPRQYDESDLHVVDVLVSIYSQFATKEKATIISNTEELKEGITHQINVLYSSIELFPEDLATNIKARPQVISKVSLDYYQLIYLAFTHAQSQINSINLVKNLSELAGESHKYLN